MTARIPVGDTFALVDDRDVDRLSRYNWYAIRQGEHVYAHTGGGGGFHAYMHRMVVDAVEGQYVGHRNLNGLDNRKDNLRISSIENHFGNQRKRAKPCTSRFKGVSWDSSRSRWKAQIAKQKNGNSCLGRFDTEEEAARVYDKAAFERWGEFARLNFPREDALGEDLRLAG